MIMKTETEKLADLEAFVKSLNSFAFEEWYGRYMGSQFHICCYNGESVASGDDAFEAWQNLVACLPEEGDDNES